MTSQTTITTPGHRLLPTVIDHYAKSAPHSVWASIPRDENDLSRGFRDITYREFGNAINHASWWLENNNLGSTISSNNGVFQETFAYIGPKDLRYPVLAVAAAKVGKKILLPSPFISLEAQLHILHVTGCSVYLYAESSAGMAERVLGQQPSIKHSTIPEQGEWFIDEVADWYSYAKEWEQAKDDPWIIFHTSGTTGLPKPVIYTQLMMTSFDAAQTMPKVERTTQFDHFHNERWYSPLPALHFVGMTMALQITTFYNMIMVIGPGAKPATAEIAHQILQYGNVTGALCPPSLIEDLCRNPSTLQLVLKRLKYIHWGGAPLNQATGDLLASKNVKLLPAIGSTEAGPYIVAIHEEDPPELNWNFYKFHPCNGIEFEARTKDLYELLFRRQEQYERYQQIFFIYPEIDVYPTKDLWAKHPTKPDLWSYAGRTDDLVILSHGEGLYATELEAIITQHPLVRSAIVGGQGRKKPFLILELVASKAVRSSSEPSESTLGAEAENDMIERIWPVVEKGNEQCSEYVRLEKRLTLLTQPTKPFVRTSKESVLRRESLALYGEEIEVLYASDWKNQG